jgi:hypothetical protein
VIPDTATRPFEDNALATVGAAVNAVIAEDADAVWTDPANNPAEVNNPALVGAAVQAVRAEEPVAKLDAAPNVAEVRFVTADCVALISPGPP